MTDIWVCGTCHSINRQRNARCYKCGASQTAATGELGDVRTERALATRVHSRYRSSLLRALIASAFLIAVAVFGVIVLILSVGAYRFIRDEIPTMVQTGTFDELALLRAAAPTIVPNLARTVCTLGALVFFAAWLSRVTANIPALGGGTPNTTPTKAFVYPFIPILNLIKVPPMIQDALYRLDPKAGGFFMILLAWVGLVGSAIVSFVVGWWINLRVISIGANATTVSEVIDGVAQIIDLQILVDIVTSLMIAGGALVLVLVIVRIETRARARDREIRATAAEAATGARVLNAGPSLAAAAITPAPPLAAVAAPGAAAPTMVAAVAADGPPLPPPEAEASSFAAGPRLRIVVGPMGITANVDDGPAEPTTLPELREAAAALARAGGTATVSATDADPETIGIADGITDALRGAGVPTQRR
jgi:hypothetical protein